MSSDQIYSAAADTHTRHLGRSMHSAPPGNNSDAYHGNGSMHKFDHNGHDVPVQITRAAKHRAKHDLPGPAGAWFRLHKQKTATSRRRQRQDVSNDNNNNSDKLIVTNEEKSKAVVNTSNTNIRKEMDGRSKDSMVAFFEQQSLSSPTKAVVYALESPSRPSPKYSGDDIHDKKQRDQSLFHDFSSDLHECNAWNSMCTSLDRIVPPLSHILLSSSSSQSCREGKINDKTLALETSSSLLSVSAHYKSILRTSISRNFALIYEIHAGKYDVCHCFDSGVVPTSLEGNSNGGAVLHEVDLCVPLLVGYVASVQCHAHSDWTALLVDEMHSVAASSEDSGGYSTNGRSMGNASRGILCWVEEGLVKQHPNWIRPGVVWMIEGAKLSLFSSAQDEDVDDDDDDDDDDDNQNETCAGTDVSPSTNNAQRREGTNNIDRMVLVGESSLIHVWTQEEAGTTFTDKEFIDLTEKRLNLVLPQPQEPEEEEEEEEDDKSVRIDKTSRLSRGAGVFNKFVQSAEDTRGMVLDVEPMKSTDKLSPRVAKNGRDRLLAGECVSQLLGHQKIVPQCDEIITITGPLKSPQLINEPPTTSSPPLLATETISTEQTSTFPCPIIHKGARPVTSESSTSTPSNYEDLNEQQESGINVRSGFKDNDSSEYSELNEMTPIQNNQREQQVGDTQSQWTGLSGNDSFDDMLDEDFPVTSCEISQRDPAVSEKCTTTVETNCMPPQSSLRFLFDSLDAEDMDCLSEEED